MLEDVAYRAAVHDKGDNPHIGTAMRTGEWRGYAKNQGTQEEAMGLESKRIEIFQFCDARIAKSMLDFNMHFAAYLPCRITLLEDKAGKAWLITMNLDILIQSADLSPELMEQAMQVKNAIQEIMQAGAEGDL